MRNSVPHPEYDFEEIRWFNHAKWASPNTMILAKLSYVLTGRSSRERLNRSETLRPKMLPLLWDDANVAHNNRPTTLSIDTHCRQHYIWMSWATDK